MDERDDWADPFLIVDIMVSNPATMYEDKQFDDNRCLQVQNAKHCANRDLSVVVNSITELENDFGNHELVDIGYSVLGVGLTYAAYRAGNWVSQELIGVQIGAVHAALVGGGMMTWAFARPYLLRSAREKLRKYVCSLEDELKSTPFNSQ